MGAWLHVGRTFRGLRLHVGSLAACGETFHGLKLHDGSLAACGENLLLSEAS